MCGFLDYSIQVDIGQKRASLMRAFPRSGYHAMLHDTGIQILLNQPRHPFVADLFPQQFHQQFVVQCIEILGQVHFHRAGVALFCVFLHLAHRLLSASFRK